MAFEITRSDGRSNQQVLIDAVGELEPGTMLSYERLNGILGFDDKDRSRQVVYAAQHRLLAEFNRVMRNVRGEGYKIAHASEHAPMAHDRKRRADIQLRKGLHMLRNVRWEDLDPESRKAHEGTLMITESLCALQMAQEKRLSKIEEAITKIVDDQGKARRGKASPG